MADFPTGLDMHPAAPLFVHPGLVDEGSYAVGVTNSTSSSAPFAGTWVANLIAYSPMYLPFDYVVRRVFWVNGSSVAANAQFGVYTGSGAQIYTTGTVAQSGANAVQYVALGASSFILTAGTYYFAWTSSAAVISAFLFATTADGGRLAGMLEQTPGSFGLPATMTPSAWTRAWGPTVAGVTRTSSGF